MTLLDELNEIKGWTFPVYEEGKNPCVSFYAFDPVRGKMRRKRVMVGRIEKAGDRRAYAQRLIHQLAERLMRGWSPFSVREEVKLDCRKRFCECCDEYSEFIHRLRSVDEYRRQTLDSYKSYLKIFRKWCEGNGIRYMEQVGVTCVSRFLDYVLIERKNSMQTRNNYLAWLKSWCEWMSQRGYLERDPTERFNLRWKGGHAKNRTVIPELDLIRLHDYLERTNRHYLLACYVIHYMFIRPNEMAAIRVGDIKLDRQCVVLHGAFIKNRKDAVVTLPDKVGRLMVELGVFNAPSSYYLFSDGFAPGRERKSEKRFRDYWVRYVRKALDFPAKYKFYSLKDTGITGMIENNVDILSVRNQARHSSIAITSIYTPPEAMRPVEELKHYDGVF